MTKTTERKIMMMSPPADAPRTTSRLKAGELFKFTRPTLVSKWDVGLSGVHSGTFYCATLLPAG